jgi:hypothetical protein
MFHRDYSDDDKMFIADLFAQVTERADRVSTADLFRAAALQVAFVFYDLHLSQSDLDFLYEITEK